MADGNYASVAQSQSDINMVGDTATTTWLTAHKPDVDRDTDNDFIQYIDLIPFITGATQDLISYATYRLTALWFADQKDYKSQQYWDGKADKKKIGIIERARQSPSTNTKTASFVAAADPRNAKTPLPCQVNIFAFDNWA